MSAGSLRVCLVVLLVLGGCGDKKKDTDKAAKDTPVLAAVEGLDAVPASATAVLGFDVGALANSPVVLRAIDRMFASDSSLEADLNAVLGACKISPKTDIEAATVALLPRAEQSDSLLVLKGKFSEPAISSCLGRFLSESGGRLESAEFQGRTLYHQVDGKAVGGLWLGFGSKNTLLVASAQEALQLALAAGPKLAAAKDGLARLAPRANTNASIWALAKVPADVGQGLIAATGGQVEAARSILGTADLEGGLLLKIQVEMQSEDDAKVLISQASIQVQGLALVLQIDAVGPLLKKMQLTTDGHWASLSWKLTERELADLLGANMAGLGSTIDNNGANEQNPAPKSELEGNAKNGN